MILRRISLVLAIITTMVSLATAQAKTPVILSTDIGNEIDDQWVIAYMMTNPRFEVLGLVSAHAPSLPDPSAYRTYLLLKDEIENRLGMRVHPPILQGGDVALSDKRTPQGNDAVRFLIEQSRSFDSTNRLTIVAIGAVTDVASAILLDPSITNRIRVVAMAFRSQTDAQEYNVLNDVPAWQVLLDSGVPVIIGPKEVCIADLPMYYDRARTMLTKDGAIGAWLWDQWNNWYFREVKPLRKNDFSRPRAIWDIITLAYLGGFATSETRPRPSLSDDLKLTVEPGQRTVVWITHVDSGRLWDDFQTRMATYVQTHALPALQ
jgi:inosine-uridine nucleoside N-ribohydrolase